ncbi:hypothetical protein EJB05_31369, partial [Eragrostis curvula]
MNSVDSKLHQTILLLLVSYFCSFHTYVSGNISALCHPADASSLLQLKRSFRNPNLASWRPGTDCCRWEAVANTASGRVISLDLGWRELRCQGLDPALFNLTSLRYLSMAGTDFMGASLPSFGFELLTEMVHLDFGSTMNLFGQLPIGIARLRKLAMLHFSSYGDTSLFLEEPSFETFVANLSSLRDLYLFAVDISSTGDIWSTQWRV